MFDFDAIFANPAVLGVLLGAGCLFLALIAIFIIGKMRGGFGQFREPRKVYQRCFSYTSGNTWVARKLLVAGGEFAVDHRNKRSFFLFPDSLVPDPRTGEQYLFLDDRCAVPLTPLSPPIFRERVKQAPALIQFIATQEDERQRDLAKQEAAGSLTQDMYKFALVFAFGIMLLAVIAVVIAKLV